MSVTSLLTETGALTNSYTYDPYGNLVSGTPDAVNYYGYNAESTNTNTGFHYLRARYYNPENGTFTTEDSDLGKTENPLIRNQYAYTANNPLNYTDPTGHSLWSRFKNTVKKATKMVKSAVTNFFSSGGKKSSSAKVPSYKPVRTINSNRISTNGVYGYQSTGVYGEKRSSSIRRSGNTTTYYNSKFLSWVWNATDLIRANVVKELCNSDNKAKKQDKEKAGTLTLMLLSC